MKKKAVRLTTILAAAALSASAFGCAAAPAAQPAAEEAPAETAEEAPAEAEEETAEEAEVTAEEAETEEAAAEETAETTRIFTDSAGREVEVDAEITRIAATGPLAQIALYAIAPDLMVGWTSDWSEASEKYIPEEYLALPVLGQLYGGKGEMNLEELLAADPQVVIDFGQPKASIVEDLDGLQEQTGIPFVHITASLLETGDAYRKLGELLGREEEGEALAAYCEETCEKCLAAAEASEPAKLLFITGENGLNVIAKDSFHAEVVDLLADNLAVVDEPSSKGTGNESDLEQIMNWNPEVIIFSPDSIYETVGEDPAWQTIPAIENHRYYEVPAQPYNWMGFPPSVQRYPGMLWLAKTLYPDAADYDLKEEIVRYYDLFYHYELTDEEYEELMKKAQ
ncbi:MAG: ABC transporter substrate-binding protein [Lachnospiraceae bacterium]|nr:ABC transporter substrate-binding protein [Lachnospiraceae bacterium]